MQIKTIVYSLIALLFATSGWAEDWVNPEKLKAQITERANTAGIKGLAYAIVSDGEIVLVETLSSDQNQNINSDSLFRVGELSKLTTSILLLRLIQDQQLANNSEAARAIGIDNRFNSKHPLKLEHLLSQTSGLPGATYKGYQSYPIDINPSQISQMDAGPLKILSTPGKHYLSSHLDFTMAAALAEIKTSTPFDDLINDLVLKPLQMDTASYSNNSAQALGQSYNANGDIAPLWKTSMRPSLAMRATINDMARLTAYIAKPELQPNFLNAATFKELFSSNAAAADAGFELHPGKGLYPYVSSGHLFWGGTGQIDGFYASMGVIPATGDGFVVLANTHKPQALRLIRENLSFFASQKLTLAPLPPTAIVNHRQHSGWWMPVGQKSALNEWLWNIGGHIYLGASSEGLKINQVLPGLDLRQLVAVDETKYRPLRNHKAALQFFEDNGQKFLISSTLEVYRKLTLATVLPYILLGLLFMVVIGGGLLTGLLSIPLILIRAITHKYTILSHSLLGFSSLCCVVTIGLFLQHDLSQDFSLQFALGSISSVSIGLAVLSSIWPLLVLINIWLLWQHGAEYSKAAFRWSVGCSAGQLLLAMYLASNHWLPLLTWKY